MSDEIWYRYEDVAYAAPADEFGESRGIGSISIKLLRFRVTRRTPKGVWLALDLGQFGVSEHLRFVLRSARKRYACPTIAEAQISFEARKRSQIRLYEARVRRAKRALVEFERTTSVQALAG